MKIEVKKLKTKNNILKVALKHFKKYGYDQTKLKTIAREVGIGEGTLYNYFATKTELLVAVIGSYLQTDVFEFDGNLESALDYYLGNIELVDKNLLRVIFSSAFTNEAIFEEMLFLDKSIVNDLATHYEINDERIIRMIYGVVYMGFISYVMSDMSVELLKAQILEDISFLLEVTIFIGKGEIDFGQNR